MPPVDRFRGSFVGLWPPVEKVAIGSYQWRKAQEKNDFKKNGIRTYELYE